MDLKPSQKGLIFWKFEVRSGFRCQASGFWCNVLVVKGKHGGMQIPLGTVLGMYGRTGSVAATSVQSGDRSSPDQFFPSNVYSLTLTLTRGLCLLFLLPTSCVLSTSMANKLLCFHKPGYVPCYQ